MHECSYCKKACGGIDEPAAWNLKGKWFCWDKHKKRGCYGREIAIARNELARSVVKRMKEHMYD